MSKVKSFRFSDKQINMIDVIEREYGVKVSDFFNDVLEDAYFRVGLKNVETRPRCYYVIDYDSDIYSQFYTSKAEALLDLRKDISHQWSLEAEVECCYGPNVIID